MMNATATPEPFTAPPSTFTRREMILRNRTLASDEEMEYGFMVILGLLCLMFFLTTSLFS
jgi:hypothetical protein